MSQYFLSNIGKCLITKFRISNFAKIPIFYVSMNHALYTMHQNHKDQTPNNSMSW